MQWKLWVVLLCGVLVLGCGGVKQEEEAQNTTAAPAVPEGPPPWEADYHEMVEVLALTAAEQNAVRTAYEEGYAAFVERLEGDEGKDLMAEEAELKKAVEQKNLSAVRSITARAAPKRRAMEGAVQQVEEGALAALPPEKLNQWNGHRVAKELLTLMEPLGLNGDQWNAIYGTGTMAVLDAQQKGEPNPMAAGFIQLEVWAEQNVLMQEQYAQYQDIKKQNPMRSLKW